jgi:hypothetical protein
MPDCYVIIQTNPTQRGVYDDIRACAEEADGMFDRIYYERENALAHAFVAYGTDDQASEGLKKLAECLGARGHTVTESSIVDTPEDLGFVYSESGSAS